MNRFCSQRTLLGFATVAGLSLWLASCKETEPDHAMVGTGQNLRLIDTYPVDVPEPSGLTLSKSGRSLWTVSDKDSGVYQIDLKGNVLSHFQTDYDDLEAVTTIDADHLAFVAERARKIVIADKGGTVLREESLAIPGRENSGPEGLTFDESAGQFHVIQESPGILVTMDEQLNEIDRRELTFAQDYSSISFDSTGKQFWVLSDLSKSIHVLDKDLLLKASFSVNVEQMEGLAIDHEARIIYLISDMLSRLYVFEFDAF